MRKASYAGFWANDVVTDFSKKSAPNSYSLAFTVLATSKFE